MVEKGSNEAMATKKTVKPSGDVTRTARAKKHLERLEAAQGKRLLVDLDAISTEALVGLLSVGFGATQKEVVQKALQAQAKKLVKKA